MIDELKLQIKELKLLNFELRDRASQLESKLEVQKTKAAKFDPQETARTISKLQYDIKSMKQELRMSKDINY